MEIARISLIIVLRFFIEASKNPVMYYLLLRFLNAVIKETTTMARRFGRSSPHPRLGPTVQLYRGDASGSLNFFCISKRLTCQRIL